MRRSVAVPGHSNARTATRSFASPPPARAATLLRPGMGALRRCGWCACGLAISGLAICLRDTVGFVASRNKLVLGWPLSTAFPFSINAWNSRLMREIFTHSRVVRMLCGNQTSNFAWKFRDMRSGIGDAVLPEGSTIIKAA